MTEHSIWTVHGLLGSILAQHDGIAQATIRRDSIQLHVAYKRDARDVAKALNGGYPRREVINSADAFEVFHVDIDGIDVMVYGEHVAVSA